MDYKEMKAEYFARYDNAAYSGDTEAENVLNLFRSAEKLSAPAKAEFVKAFNLEFALDGEMYLGGRKTAEYKYPNLIKEGPSCGIKIVTR